MAAPIEITTLHCNSHLCVVYSPFGLIQRHAINTKIMNSDVCTIYKESLLCENSTYKYDLHNKINMSITNVA